jgi:hypothetical protein
VARSGRTWWVSLPTDFDCAAGRFTVINAAISCSEARIPRFSAVICTAGTTARMFLSSTDLPRLSGAIFVRTVSTRSARCTTGVQRDQRGHLVETRAAYVTLNLGQHLA